jgi:hypothetical protein
VCRDRAPLVLMQEWQLAHKLERPSQQAIASSSAVGWVGVASLATNDGHHVLGQLQQLQPVADDCRCDQPTLQFTALLSQDVTLPFQACLNGSSERRPQA